jgi:hypothetical protein
MAGTSKERIGVKHEWVFWVLGLLAILVSLIVPIRGGR